MPAPSPLVKTLLRKARKAEEDTAGGGDTYLDGLLDVCSAIAVAGGQQMVSASAAGKAYAFATGYSVPALTEAVDEAMGIWAEYEPEQLSRLLDYRPRRIGRVTFRPC